MSTWVDQIIGKLEAATGGVLEVEIGGQKVVATLGKEVIDWFKDNRQVLINVGLDTFKNFLVLIHEKKNDEAFNLLLAKMEADDIIKRIQMNTQALKQDNDLRDRFVASLKKLVFQYLTQGAVKLLIGLLI